MQKASFETFDEASYQKELAEKRATLVKEPLIQAFLTKNHLKIEDIPNLSLFKEYLKSQQECVNCHGLNECVKTHPGQRMSVEYNGILVPVCEHCPYYYAKQEHDSHLKYFVYSDIPENLQNVFLSTMKVDNNEDARKLFILLNQIILGEFDKGLYIYGNFGVGKTYSCIAFLNELARKHHKVAFVKMNDFANKMRNLAIKDNDQMHDILDRLKEVPYLVIDDIGAETTTSFIRDDLLFNILDYRMSHNLMTIFTSNHSLKTLYDAFLYDKNQNRDDLKAGRLMERIRTLGLEFHLSGNNHRV